MTKSALAILAIALASGSAAAQDYPTKPVRIVAPFSAGGAVDVPARIIAARLSESWGRAVFVENKPGAGSTLGAELVARAAPDGHTLLFTSNTHIISGALYKKLGYDPIADFEPVIEIGSAPNVLVVHPGLPANDVAELIALAKAKPGQLDYASSGNGSSQHLFCALFASMAGIKLNHVPYKGSGQATTDLLAGRVPVSCPGVNNVLAHIRQGRLRALAVTSARRAADLPGVPTLAEAGVPGYEATLWLGILAPKGTPAPIVARLYADLGKLLARDDVKQSFAAIGTEIDVKPGAELGKLMRGERDRWGRLIAASGARID
jgi:tripartite-type tricarboxylate transporter receptor subunit TctC